MSETKIKIYKNADPTIGIIKQILHYNKNAQKKIQLASSIKKWQRKIRTKTWWKHCRKTILRKGMIAEIEKEEKSMDNKLFKNYFTNYQSPSDIYKKLRKTEGKKNEDQVYAIKKVLDKIKNLLKKCLKIKNLRLKKTKR